MTYVSDKVTWAIDTSVTDAYSHIIESKWLDKMKNIYSVERYYIINCSVDDIFDYFLDTYPDLTYRVFYGSTATLHNDQFAIRVAGDVSSPNNRKRFDNRIIYSGDRKKVREVIKAFETHFEDLIVPDGSIVTMVIDGGGRLEHINLPVKTDRKFYPEMYPCLEDPSKFIDDFLDSSANVLILTGPPGLGKSALINEIITRADRPTFIVFDQAVMKTDKLYTDFINKALNDGSGLMIMEDADLILSDRTVTQNEMMSRLLNLSDGIMDTSGAKFIFTANLKDKSEIDDALLRPGRCFDVVEFRNLTYQEAVRAAEAIGVELYDHDKTEYTVAEIFNSTNNRKEKFKFGFV